MVDYWRPETLTEALKLLAKEPRIAAGCTDLFPATDRPDLTIGQSLPILDITAISSLRGISKSDAGIRIGATTSWAEIGHAELPPACDALKSAALEVGSIQIQNTGTIAGNLCNASPAADGVPPLLVLDAKVELQSRYDKRVLALQDFFTGPRQTDLRSDELLTAIILPISSLRGVSAFRKLGARRYLVISIVMSAIRLEMESGRVKRAAVAVGSCSAFAKRLKQVEIAIVEGQDNVDELIGQALDPISDIRADADYRMDAAGIIIERLLKELKAFPDRMK